MTDSIASSQKGGSSTYPKMHDVFLHRAYKLFIRYRILIFSLITGFLVGRFSDGLANPQVKTFPDLLLDVLNVIDRPINWVNWIVLLVALLIPLLSWGAARWRRQQSYDTIMTSILQRLKDKSLLQFNAIGVEKSLTLQKCPEMEHGWLPSEIEIEHKNTQFRLPSDLENAYKDYFEQSFRKEHGEDPHPTTVMLVEKPVAWTDRTRLLLRTKLNFYSYSQFYWHRVILDIDRYNPMITDLYERGDISFPHNLCMHLVVLTKDDKVLLTLRSKKVGSDQGTWSCSVEENLRPGDLRGERKATFMRWMSRAIFEELGVNSHCYTENNLRILSVFLEANRMNISMVGLVSLDLNQEELSKIIASLPRNDYEFTDYEFMGLQEMARQLVHPTRNYHPTSRYRMLMTLLHRYGEPDFARRFIELVSSN